MMRGRGIAAAVVVLAVAACGGGESAGITGAPADPSGGAAAGTEAVSSTVVSADGQVVEAVVSDVLGVAPVGFTAQDGLVSVEGRTLSLAYQPMDALAGMLVPEAVPTFDGKTLYYTMWEGWEGLDGLQEGEVGGVPVIRRVDVAGGVDDEFRRGSYAAAVSVDGWVAYVEDLDGAYRFSIPNPTRVMVASPGGGADEVWSTDSDIRYVTVGWAGEVLLAYQLEGEYVRTVAFYGPRESRLLIDGGMVVAISSDGTKVLLIEQENWTRFVVEGVSDGAVLWSGEIDTALGPLSCLYGNDWEGDRIVVAGALGDGGRQPYVPGFALLGFRDGILTLERFVAVPTKADYLGLIAARFTPEGKIRLLASTTLAGDDVEFWEMVCDAEAATCQPVTPARNGYFGVAEVNNWSGGTRP